jgi:hypothetical protein
MALAGSTTDPVRVKHEGARGMKKRLMAVAIAGCAALSVQAKEGGDQYPFGAENWLAGAVPPPGTYFKNYLGYYTGDLQDGSGSNASFPGTGKTGDVSAVFDGLRVIHVTDTKILGANWGMHIIVPLVSQDVDFGAPNGGERTSGLGDITINPMILSWHGEEWHFVAAFDVYLPTGRYDQDDPRKSIGTNYYSYEPVFAASYLGKDGWELSAKFMYNIKAKNKDSGFAGPGTDGTYESGDEFHMDYLVGKRFGPWGVGLAGYYLKQMNNDEYEGVTVPAVPGLWSKGRKGEVFAVGPAVIYQAPKQPILMGIWHHETSAENRFEGDKFWFKLIIPLAF